MKANPVARDLRSPKYRMRVVEPGKGRGSYKRRGKHEQAEIYSDPVIQSTHQQDEVHNDTSRNNLEGQVRLGDGNHEQER